MVQLSSTEHALVDDLLECLATAMARTDAVEPEYANKTKLQKLLYLAIDEFDLPLTYSWYLAGAIVPGDPVSPSGLQTAFDDLPSTEQPSVDASESESIPDDMGPSEPEPPTADASETEVKDTVADFKRELRSGDEDETLDPVLFSDTAAPADASAESDPTNPAATDELGDRRDEVIDFYEQILPDVWYQNTMQFLQNFYLSHAPEEYRDLYLQSTHLRTRLHEVEQTVTAHIEGEKPDQDLSELTKAVGLEISDLHYSIRKSDSLAATLNDVVRGTDRIEDGLMMLAQLEPEDLTETHRQVVEEMRDFFYYSVWRLPCLVISQETATGPSADALSAQRQEQLASFDKRLRQRCREFERTLDRAGLKPTYADYDIPDDDVNQSVAELTETYLDS
jgi:hypothetical protein